MVIAESSRHKLIPAVVRRLRAAHSVSKDHFRESLLELLDSLRNDISFQDQWSIEWNEVLAKEGISELILESNLRKRNSFWQEFFTKVRHKILPPLTHENSLKYRLHRIFNFDVDYPWLLLISQEEWNQLFDLTPVTFTFDMRSSIADAMQELAVRIAALGLDNALEMRHRGKKNQKTIFRSALQSCQIYAYSLAHQSPSIQEYRKVAFADLAECVVYLKELDRAADVHGTDINQSFLASKCEELIARFEHLGSILEGDQKHRDHALVYLIHDIVKEEYSSQNIFQFFRDSIYLLSLRISEHVSHTGEHYIAQDRREYFKFFGGAVGAGFVVSILVFVKAFIHQLSLPPLWEAMFFSINYVVGFVLIQQFHFTLATKQPAMTATSIAKALQSNGEQVNFRQLAVVTSRVFHTQTISFIGNLLIVFTLPFFIGWMFNYVFQFEMFTPEQAQNVAKGQHPYLSGALWYAAITGVYLFISGLIAGYVDNRFLFARIPERIRHYRKLKRWIGSRRTDRLASYLDENAGSLAGNITLGFFLGTATFIGEITGLPFDIRHITFAAGSFANSVAFAEGSVSLAEIIIITLGILGIGFINFSVSFGLAFFTACRSRGVRLVDTPDYLRELWTFFKQHPTDFFIPPSRQRL